MNEEQRDSIGGCGGLMYVVDIKFRKAICFQTPMEVWQLVEFGLLCSPVELSLPVLCQALDVLERSTVVPT